MAADIAKGVDGVATVELTILVEKDRGGTVIDKQVDWVIDKTQGEIADALLEMRQGPADRRDGKSALAIEVEADGGVLSLTGTVPDAIRRDLAVQTASKTTGATRGRSAVGLGLARDRAAALAGRSSHRDRYCH
jgi:osmotically-inducible protein OsmY